VSDDDYPASSSSSYPSSPSSSTTPAAARLLLLVKGVKVGPTIPYSRLTVGVLKETYSGECRVSLAPSNVRTLVDAGMRVVVERGGECFDFFYLKEARRDATTSF